jgi:hypothetical protein
MHSPNINLEEDKQTTLAITNHFSLSQEYNKGIASLGELLPLCGLLV